MIALAILITCIVTVAVELYVAHRRGELINDWEGHVED